MSQDHAHDHDGHEHTELELSLARALGSAQAHIEMLSVSEHILRKAMLALLPQEGETITIGDSVTINIDELNMDDGEGGQAKTVTVFRSGEFLDIRLG